MPRPIPVPEISDIMPFPAHAFSQSSHSWAAGLPRVTLSRASRGSAHDAFDEEFMRHFFGTDEQDTRGHRGHRHGERH
jgi:hypothetical protein